MELVAVRPQFHQIGAVGHVLDLLGEFGEQLGMNVRYLQHPFERHDGFAGEYILACAFLEFRVGTFHHVQALVGKRYEFFKCLHLCSLLHSLARLGSASILPLRNHWF
ncbi:hypothetical protein BBOMB_0606 [Bifidobacterium bombi DSM 19703]|uniref:Uncharacterized protein n=1 Tax=Bifidobacterium bombi DSM 19703 TaxID=1341695 RepID=A0A080N305_9BIFI|nr:hypothetical protein BBOMB_0606 [Bifidobacterium bombi DSM 19703]